MIRNWFTFLCSFTGEPKGGVICGECAEKHNENEIQEIKDPCNIYSENCQNCGKNCGSYFHRKAA